MINHLRHRFSARPDSMVRVRDRQARLSQSFLGAFTLVALVALLWVPVDASLAQEQEVIENGRQLFNQKCAICHGLEGKGDGTLGLQLKRQPADLSQLSMRSGGKFPFWQVYGKIDGREDIIAHGPREMPVWGSNDRYVGTGGRLASGQILEIVFFLQSIQSE